MTVYMHGRVRVSDCNCPEKCKTREIPISGKRAKS